MASAGLLHSQGEVMGASAMRTLENGTFDSVTFVQETWPMNDAKNSSGSDGATLAA